jgi:hypothetical protein
MTDEPFYSPNWKLPPPRTKPRPGESLWEFRQNHVTRAAELRYHGEWGVETQILRNGELASGRRFPTRALAIAEADAVRREIEKDTWALGWNES